MTVILLLFRFLKPSLSHVCACGVCELGIRFVVVFVRYTFRKTKTQTIGKYRRKINRYRLNAGEMNGCVCVILVFSLCVYEDMDGE